jgi:hypothetical protein
VAVRLRGRSAAIQRPRLAQTAGLLCFASKKNR